MKLQGKIIIKGIIKTLTGLHIGGSKTSLNIGGIDNNVIKTVKGVPYIPGSSFKGKLRSLLAKKEGSLFFSVEERKKFLGELQKDDNIEAISLFKDKDTDEQFSYIMDLFGYSGDNDDKAQIGYTRLLVRDAYLINAQDTTVFASEEGVFAHTDSKFENVINRRTGTAEHPRQMERVPVGAKFAFELVYNLFDDVDALRLEEHLQHIIVAIKLLEDDFIGGQGSRGYGQIDIGIDMTQTTFRKIMGNKYEEDTTWNVNDTEKNAALQSFKTDLQNI